MIELTKDKKHIIIKRDGREEPFNEEKLRKVINWATGGIDAFTNQLLEGLNIKINDKMKIEVLYDELINTAVNMISPLYPVYDTIAEKLYLMKIYKETCGLKKIGSYPHIKNFLKKGIKYKIYDKDIVKLFSDKELDKINSMIEPNRDLLFTYKGLAIFYKKYCKNIGNKKLELPQITYMAAAMFSFYNDYYKGENKDKLEISKAERLKYIKKTYDMLSRHEITFATPRIANSMTIKAQLASCILNTPDDDTWSLNQTDGNMALYSKFSGGIAYDASYIRASGSTIQTNRGRSDGPIPFIKRVEQTISSFNQGGVRKGACVITFPWWHLDVLDLIMLKDAGGTEDTRARKLVYSIRISNIFRERVNKDGYVTLFDPKETPLLNEEYGEKFNVAYMYYESKSSIRKKKIKAKDLLFQILKVRQETGNLYLTFVDNINEQNMVNKFVGASNLCQEIVIPSYPSKLIDEKYVINEEGEYEIIQRKKSGEIGICNLVSINLMSWVNFDEEKKKSFCYTLLRGCDNIIDTQFYPVKEGEIANKKNRPIGIGVINYANLLASNKLKYTDREALEFTNKVFDDLYYHIYQASNLLAKERGAYKTFNESKWKDGLTPFHISLLNKSNKLNVSLDKEKWDKLSEEIKTSGVRFSFHGAIAPTATSGKSVSATESIEPIVDLYFVEEGIQTLPSLVPNIKKNREYYQRCWSIPAKTIIELAAVRQRYIDQSQSLNLYYVKPDSAKELWDDIQYAMDLGLKTLYYMKTPKSNFELEEVCESCT
ncbi:ribonucleoside-diphosphate reductase subunit alpha [Brachyspira sp. G79]|uniref:ribonucleoside-diphosphate reductase subunit alpha n=1 Tax=Brachyspira sp. G79 TaxID=1358104 RepID=UPI000BBBF292|nr:ribonucleoside-diphosphate reductase subunit alpha [Brachyspira sp. G79]PCG19156.1 ribonucleotide-diphosphate reductase [Brachyspira sp. G79]